MGPRRVSPEIVVSGNSWTIGELEGESDVRNIFESICEHYAFQGFAVLSLPSRSVSSLFKLVKMTSWPMDIVKQYDAFGLLKASPVFEQLRNSTVPFTIDNTSPLAFSSSVNIAKGLFARAGFGRMVFVPVHDADGRRSAVAFGGDRSELSREELNVVTFVAGHAFNRLSEIWSASRRAPGSLSRREIECLRLAAAGKTTVEMARLLSLSEYTVNHYLNRATRKLDSVNRVQTIAKALRAGLIA
ncbi:LuxR C-terminal-related transcriptional regulator [Rhizobium sp. NFR03]|uniref:helix-turn-helix transcriptional regulator n=1 Tax=Rhizobium sp. NFR03 TaxID=1566263 RepID=UPI0008B0C867|nr:LuxR C-terminal-related transcriptional regulator [Rhizobium sp. NFR03]SER97283.1 DNA-binding transcriptional regulator, CsgD family [Rhizobium sp. NFR03]